MVVHDTAQILFQHQNGALASTPDFWMNLMNSEGMEERNYRKRKQIFLIFPHPMYTKHLALNLESKILVVLSI